jgi:hypothetical protein
MSGTTGIRVAILGGLYSLAVATHRGRATAFRTMIRASVCTKPPSAPKAHAGRPAAPESSSRSALISEIVYAVPTGEITIVWLGTGGRGHSSPRLPRIPA